MEAVITRKRWRWTGHMLRKDANSITKLAIHLTPEGKRKRGRPETTWRRTVEVQMKMNHSWGTIQRLAGDGRGWRSFVVALHTSWRDGSSWMNEMNWQSYKLVLCIVYVYIFLCCVNLKWFLLFILYSMCCSFGVVYCSHEIMCVFFIEDVAVCFPIK